MLRASLVTLAALLALTLLAAPTRALTSGPVQGQDQEQEEKKDVGDKPIFPESIDLPAPTHDCATCSGKGRVVLPCDHCGGKGKGACLECDTSSKSRRRAEQNELMRVVNPEAWEMLAPGMKDLQKSIDDINAMMGVPAGEEGRGKLKCPENCMRGRSIINPGHECLVCEATGAVDCAACKGKGEAKCQVCAGKRRHEVVCPECIGAARSFPAVDETRPAEHCAWCQDERVRNCGVCKGADLVPGTCSTCRGDGEVLCQTCRGTTHDPCRPCSGTGDLSGFVGRSGRCTDCKAKGFTKCGDCKKGFARCADCVGKGERVAACNECLSVGYTLCRGCRFGSARAWLATAERLAALDDARGAVAQMDAAIARVEARNRAAMEELVGTDKERRALERAQKRELKSLRQRRAKFAKAAGK